MTERLAALPALIVAMWWWWLLAAAFFSLLAYLEWRADRDDVWALVQWEEKHR